MGGFSKIALFLSLFLVIGFPMIFMVISMFTDQWVYLFSGSVPSILIGVAGFFFIMKQQEEKPKNEELRNATEKHHSNI